MSAEEITIYNKLSKITNEADKIPKNGYNDFNKFKYVLAIDVVAEIKKLLILNNVLFCPNEVEFDRLSKKEDGKNFHSTIKCNGMFKNIDPPYDEHVVTYYSVSADTLDKDIFKAKTNGLKYLFIQQFLLITDDWVDTEKQTEPTEMTSGDYKKIKANAKKANITEGELTMFVKWLAEELKCDTRDLQIVENLLSPSHFEVKLDEYANKTGPLE